MLARLQLEVLALWSMLDVRLVDEIFNIFLCAAEPVADGQWPPGLPSMAS